MIFPKPSLLWRIGIKFIFFYLALGLMAAWPASGDEPHPIVLKGREELRGARIEQIRVFKVLKGKEVSIPFQVDQVNSNDEFVLSGGLPFTAKSDDGFFDENDELVFLANQSGDCQKPRKIPVDWQKSWIVKIEIPNRHVSRCVIVALSNLQETESFPSEVKFDSVEKTVDTESYHYTFNDRHPVLLGQLSLKRNGKMIPIIKSSQFLFNFVLPWYLPNFELTHANFSSDIESWQSGPVRTIVAVGVKFKQLLSMMNLHMFSELVFYSSSFSIPTPLEMRFDPSTYLKVGTGMTYALSFAESGEVEASFPTLPSKGPQELMRAGLRAAQLKDFSAKAKIGDTFFVLRVKLDQVLQESSLPPFLIRQTDFLDHLKSKDWSWLPRLRGDFGVFVDTSGLRQGNFDFGLDLFLSSEADENIIADYESVTTSWLSIASQ